VCSSDLGLAVERLFPSLHVSPGAFAVVAMAATFGAATRATFTAIVFVFELTRDYDVMLPLMLATVIADLVARQLMTDSIMTEKLTRRGLRVPADYAADPYRTASVVDVMTTPVDTLSATTTVGAARERLARGPHGAYPIVDEQQRCVGIVARGDLLRQDLEQTDAVIEHASRDLVSVRPDEPAIAVLHLMVEEQVEHVPVLDGDGRLVGICTRTDLLKIRADQLAAERHQPGWTLRPRRR